MAAAISPAPVHVERWPSERRLALLVWITALSMWLLIAVSMIGLMYAALLGVFFFFAHLAFIAYLRGNAVRLSPEQLPELYERVQTLSARIGLAPVPDAYVMQSGGVLNALATRFLGTNLIVLYSDLLEACGDNEPARDFIIAHELGHLHAGHLRWNWLLIPGLAMPFLGHAYSRAREYTCDRYGFAASTNRERALDGLSVLAAGGAHASRVNRRALVAQRSDLETAWMKLASWLFTHPSIAHRLAALDPTLGEARIGRPGARVGALAAAGLLFGVPVIAMGAGMWALGKFGSTLAPAQVEQPAADLAADYTRAFAEQGLQNLANAVDDHHAQFGSPPANLDALYAHWLTLNPGQPEPIDPYDGARFGYSIEGTAYYIVSAGPDAASGEDDLYWEGELGGAASAEPDLTGSMDALE